MSDSEGMNDYQIPNPKFQIPNKSQMGNLTGMKPRITRMARTMKKYCRSSAESVKAVVTGFWDLELTAFGSWDFTIGIWNLLPQAALLRTSVPVPGFRGLPAAAVPRTRTNPLLARAPFT